MQSGVHTVCVNMCVGVHTGPALREREGVGPEAGREAPQHEGLWAHLLLAFSLATQAGSLCTGRAGVREGHREGARAPSLCAGQGGAGDRCSRATGPY